MAATIKIKNSSTAGAAPTSSDLVQGELAVNVTDKRLYTENSGGTIVELGTNPSVPVTFPDGSASAPSLTNDGDTNTGLFFPAADTVGIATGGSERARVDSSGNLGLGVTPSAWYSTSTNQAFQTASGSVYSKNGTSFGLGQNVYASTSGGGWKYVNNGYASLFDQDSSKFTWYTAASGTAGNAITFTQAMTLDASGNLGVGTTSPSYRLEVRDTADAVIALVKSGANSLRFLSTSSGGVINQVDNNPLAFYTNNTERARIDSSGNLLLGKTSTSASQSGILLTPSLGGQDLFHPSGTASGSGYVQFWYNASYIGGITQNGTSAVAYNTTSDYRLKHDIAPITGALAKVAALKPCTYKWNADNSDGEGFIAHELAEVCPHAVTGAKDAVETYIDEEGNEQTRPKYQGIDTSFLVATLTAALQEAHGLIKDLQTRVAALES